MMPLPDPIRFALETYRSGYRFFYKHYGARAVCRIRRVYLLHLILRWMAYRTMQLGGLRRSLTGTATALS